jgi:DNA-binding NarL/FixJ family response regulator
MALDMAQPLAYHEDAGTLKVLVVDDHIVFAQLIDRALAHEDDLVCVGIAPSLAKARAMCDAVRPDVVLMDVQLPDGDGVDAGAKLVCDYPEMRIVVLSAFIDGPLLHRASRAGVTALQAKDGDLDDLLHAVRFSQPGSLSVPPRLLHQLMSDKAPVEVHPDLTQREREVLRLLASGRDLTFISREMSISLHTCRGHVKNLLAKLGVHSQLQAVVVAMRHGLIDPDDEHP